MIFNSKTPGDKSVPDTDTSVSSVPDRHTDNEISVAGPSDTDKAKMSKSVIDEWLVMKGDLESEGDILVKGKVLGNVTCKMLIVDEKAEIEGGINADEVVIRGTTKGKVRAKRVLLQKTARVLSEIVHETFAAEEGAQIDGALRRMENVPAENAVDAKPAQKAAKKPEKVNPEATGKHASHNGHSDSTNGGVTHN